MLPDKDRCPECGAENEPGAFYCRSCRYFLGGGPRQATAAPRKERREADQPVFSGGMSGFTGILGGGKKRESAVSRPAAEAKPRQNPGEEPEKKQMPAPSPQPKREPEPEAVPPVSPEKSGEARQSKAWLVRCPACGSEISLESAAAPEECPACGSFDIAWQTPYRAGGGSMEKRAEKSEIAPSAPRPEPSAPSEKKRRPRPENRTTLTLVPLDPGETVRFAVDTDAAIVGRAGTVSPEYFTADRFPCMSNQHIELRRFPTGWYVTDTSSCGTLLNGRAMTKGAEMRLKDGDFLTLYDYQLRVVIQ